MWMWFCTQDPHCGNSDKVTRYTIQIDSLRVRRSLNLAIKQAQSDGATQSTDTNAERIGERSLVPSVVCVQTRHMCHIYYLACPLIMDTHRSFLWHDHKYDLLSSSIVQFPGAHTNCATTVISYSALNVVPAASCVPILAQSHTIWNEQ